MSYKDNLWLEKFEIKHPDYRYVERPLTAENKIKYMPSRFVYDGRKWMPKDNDGSGKNSVRIMFTGDITCFEKQLEEALTRKNYDFDYVFEHIRGIFGQADLVVGNLETMIVPEAPYRTELFVSEQTFHCNAPVEFIDAIRKSGMDCVTNANNHDLDTGAVGIGETIDYAEQMGLIQTGTFKTYKKHFEMFSINGLNIAIVPLTTYHNYKEDNLTEEGRQFLLNTYERHYAKELYEEAKRDGADIVIVCIHWGSEYKLEYNEVQELIANNLAKMGYDIIIGSHPHVLEPFEYIKTKKKTVPVFYSMGNFVTHHTENDRAKSIIACVDLIRGEKGISIECSCIPICVTNRYGKKKYTIIPLKEESRSKRNKEEFNRILSIVGDKLPVNESISFNDCPQRDVDPHEDKPPKKKRKKVVIDENTVFPVHYDAGKFEYDIYEDHAVVTGVSQGIEAAALTMSQMIKGRPITGIVPGAFENGIMKKFAFSHELDYVSDRAFRNCRSLEGVFQFTDNIRGIGEQAYENCEKLRSVVIKSNVKEICRAAFRNCKDLRSVKISGGVERIADDAFEGCSGVVFYCPPGSEAWNYALAHGFEVREMIM